MALTDNMANWNKRMKAQSKKTKKGGKITFKDQDESGGKMVYN
jgi:hypothetical protein